jgi:hypothetical protein
MSLFSPKQVRLKYHFWLTYLTPLTRNVHHFSVPNATFPHGCGAAPAPQLQVQ